MNDWEDRSSTIFRWMARTEHAWMIESTDLLPATSRWMARTVAQVSRAPQAFSVLLRPVFKLKGPKRLTPVTEKGGDLWPRLCKVSPTSYPELGATFWQWSLISGPQCTTWMCAVLLVRSAWIRDGLLAEVWGGSKMNGSFFLKTLRSDLKA